MPLPTPPAAPVAASEADRRISNASRSGDGRRRHIPEIDGLRGVAIALIVIYHVWLNRVSGGVDVFFLLSGFLVTTSLMRSTGHGGRVAITAFYARVARRIFPPALVVLVGIVVATIVWLPQSRWRETLGDVVAAALYVVNWRLAENAVDYLASQYAASPVQHYWSLAVQAQFYLAWPLLIMLAAWLAMRLTFRPRQVLAAGLATVFALSLFYSIYRTAADQTYAYFDSFARLWEFALGGLLVLVLPRLRLGRTLAVALGWVALVALLVCGLVFRGGDEFPGWAALWPTVAAAALIATAGTGSPYGADRLLRTPALRWLGGLSYSLYLWHWPVLICYLVVAGRTVPTLRGGVLVIAASVLLAIVTKALVEDRLPVLGLGQRTPRGAFTLAAGLVVAVLLTTTAWTGFMQHQQNDADPVIAQWSKGDRLGTYAGAAAAAYGEQIPSAPYRPGAFAVRDDRAGVLYPDCHQNQHDEEPILCYIGPDDAERSVAVVGGSRAQHWLPALEEVGNEHGWQIISITKSACLFSPEPQYDSCDAWNRHVLAELAELRPDAVFTTATRVPRSREITHDGYVEHWRSLAALGISVLAVRDVPRPLVDIPDCVEIHGPNSDECGSSAQLYGLDQPAELEARSDLPGSVSFIDLTNLFCPDGFCPAVIGNIIVYHDNSHITATYARTVAPFLAEAILETTGW